MLILDEATSSVDSESELAIQNALSELVKGRTSIIIAHRLSTLRNCDSIMVIDEGRLAEKGSHQELMKLDGKYAKLVKIQSSVNKTDTIDSITAHDEEKKKLGGQEIAPRVVADPDTGLTPITGHRPRWLNPEIAKVHMGNRNALHVTILNERIYNGVFALRCMPVRHPDKYLSLRWFNAEDREQEIGLIRDLSEWPAEGAEAHQRVAAAAVFRAHDHVGRVDGADPELPEPAGPDRLGADAVLHAVELRQRPGLRRRRQGAAGCRGEPVPDPARVQIPAARAGVV